MVPHDMKAWQRLARTLTRRYLFLLTLLRKKNKLPRRGSIWKSQPSRGYVHLAGIEKLTDRRRKARRKTPRIRLDGNKY